MDGLAIYLARFRCQYQYSDLKTCSLRPEHKFCRSPRAHVTSYKLKEKFISFSNETTNLWLAIFWRWSTHKMPKNYHRVTIKARAQLQINAVYSCRVISFSHDCVGRNHDSWTTTSINHVSQWMLSFNESQLYLIWFSDSRAIFRSIHRSCKIPSQPWYT